MELKSSNNGHLQSKGPISYQSSGSTGRRRLSVRNIRENNDPSRWMGTQMDGLAEAEQTTSRKIWLLICRITTFWLPDPLLKLVPSKRDPAVRLAFREKLALCVLFAAANAACITVLLFVNPDWTSRDRIILQEGFLAIANQIPSRLLVYRSGHIWQLGAVVGTGDSRYQQMLPFIGMDVTRYPRTDYRSVLQCPGLSNPNAIQARGIVDSINATGQPLLATPINVFDDPNLYTNRTKYATMAFHRTNIAWRRDFVRDASVWLSMNGHVYNLTDYFSRGYLPFFSNQTESILTQYAGQELPFDVVSSLESGVVECLDQLFLIGKLGTEPGIIGTILSNIVTGTLVVSLSLICLKFAAGAPIPGWARLDKPDARYFQQYVMMFVPCYTEDRQSLQQTMKSLAETEYPDDKKLLVVVCDGMVAGRNNEGTLTPKIVLDILGSKSGLHDAQAFPYDSAGENNSAYNEAKVYSGYFISGTHRIPYLIIVKIGHLSEQIKPGNRGKRDSQAILMTFLSKVYYQEPMNPLEFELSYQLKNFLGLQPEWFEFVLMVDADTIVGSNSLAELMNQIAFDPDMLGICGETRVANNFDSLTTMIQVFEYFISHRLSKAFESLFGIVTCLPGCFSLWRIKSTERNMALLIAKDIVIGFKSCQTDTLHSKNLLLLGEDRYLTTLMLKNFSGMSTCFTPTAMCKTFVPSSLRVLLSQRRRWINSTIHNLCELLFLNSCSYGLMGTRLLMLIDLVSNILLPGTFVFMIAMVYQIIVSPMLPYIALILTGCFYGIQVLLVLLSGRFMQLAWMAAYLIATPIFYFVFPLYAFWNFDNFTCKSRKI